jgi:FixJ family two-component response regulator
MQIWRDTESVDEHRPVDATGLDSKLEDELRTTLARIMSGNKNSVCSKLNAIARSNKNEFGDACHALSAKFSLLTKRELEMVCGICAGRMQTHIARDAGYDPRLSSVIRKSIVKKLNCSDLFRPYRRKNG